MLCLLYILHNGHHWKLKNEMWWSKLRGRIGRHLMDPSYPWKLSRFITIYFNVWNIELSKKNFKLPSWIINQKNLKQHVTVEKSRHLQRFYSLWFSIYMYMTAYTQYRNKSTLNKNTIFLPLFLTVSTWYNLTMNF